jgi:hypothetical protein
MEKIKNVAHIGTNMKRLYFFNRKHPLDGVNAFFRKQSYLRVICIHSFTPFFFMVVGFGLSNTV